jgi:hypothetical protein
MGGGDYWLTRYVFQRALGVVYLIAFVCALNQFRPLLGERGLLPVPLYIRNAPFRESPSLFYFLPKDWAFAAAAWIGIALSCLVIAGVATRFSSAIAAGVWALIWVLYLSFVNVGQIFYGFGWESILLEAGFFAVFLGADTVAPQPVALWMLRWLEFRVMFGAGLIKLRGDPCWRDLTCLNYHYETQPMPNPLSWYFHWAPAWTHRAGVAFNHFSELLVPFGYFLPQPYASVAGGVTIVFQGLIMASGNLSWLNLLTIVLALPMIQGKFLGGKYFASPTALAEPHIVHKAFVLSAAFMVVLLSVRPVMNMLSPRQVMNTSFNPFQLVGTYGAFGSVTRTRYEVVVEGTQDAVPGLAKWREYEFKGKPGDVMRAPPQIAPYHLRLDWLMWFAAMGNYYQHPWFVHFVEKLLEGDAATLGLLRGNPFPDGPPRYVRAMLYQYDFTTPAERRATGAWWRRELAGPWFPAVSLDDPDFQRVIAAQGWSVSGKR